MVICFSQIPFDEFREKRNHIEYIKECDFFVLKQGVTKKGIPSEFDIVDWYYNFSEIPLYMYILSDRYVAKTFDELKNYDNISIRKTIPKNEEETQKYNRIENKILNETHKSLILDNIKHINFSKGNMTVKLDNTHIISTF